MAKKETADKKADNKTRGEQEEKSAERDASAEDRRDDKRKLPEPPGNLRRRGEWFQKRH